MHREKVTLFFTKVQNWNNRRGSPEDTLPSAITARDVERKPRKEWKKLFFALSSSHHNGIITWTGSDAREMFDVSPRAHFRWALWGPQWWRRSTSHKVDILFFGRRRATRQLRLLWLQKNNYVCARGTHICLVFYLLTVWSCHVALREVTTALAHGNALRMWKRQGKK